MNIKNVYAMTLFNPMRSSLLGLLVAFIAFSARPADIPETTNMYDVVYHWGLINKVAGHGYVTYHASGNNFQGQLEGHSIPWGGRIYTVRTSLSALFGALGAHGVPAESVIGQTGLYTKPPVGQTGRSNNKYKNIQGGGSLSASPQTMEAVTIMSDMLSIFYYAHTIDFGSLAVGQELFIPVRNNGNPETLYLTYQGLTDFNYQGYTTRAYQIVFRYTFEGAPDRYPVTCLISTSSRIPVSFTSDLLIGKITMKYTP